MIYPASQNQTNGEAGINNILNAPIIRLSVFTSGIFIDSDKQQESSFLQRVRKDRKGSEEQPRASHINE